MTITQWHQEVFGIIIDEINDDPDENDNNNRINNNKTITSKSFEYRTKLIESTQNINNILDAEVVVPLTYLSNFWRSLDLPLKKDEIELDLSWSDKHNIWNFKNF